MPPTKTQHGHAFLSARARECTHLRASRRTASWCAGRALGYALTAFCCSQLAARLAVALRTQRRRRPAADASIRESRRTSAGVVACRCSSCCAFSLTLLCAFFLLVVFSRGAGLVRVLTRGALLVWARSRLCAEKLFEAAASRCARISASVVKLRALSLIRGGPSRGGSPLIIARSSSSTEVSLKLSLGPGVLVRSCLRDELSLLIS